MADIFTPMPIYCEYFANGLMQPLNFWSNLCYVLVASYCLYVFRGLHVKLLSILSLLVASGSMLFHYFAQQWSYLADILPIIAFIVVCCWLVGRRLLHWNTLITSCSLIVLGLLTTICKLILPHLNGSNGYIPTFLMLIFYAINLRLNIKIRNYLFISIISLFFALIMRSTDLLLCSVVPIGTHWLWHIGTAIAMLGCIASVSDNNKINYTDPV